MEYAYKFRIYPTPAQEELIQKTFGCCRFIYNHFLSERIALYQNTGKSTNWREQCKELPGLKIQYPWLKEVDSHALQATARNLHRAYDNFFRRVKNSEKPGFPKYKSKSDSRRSFTTVGKTLAVSENTVKLPKLGEIKCIVTRPVQGRILNMTISQTPTKKYFVSICCTDVELDPLPLTGKETGVDVGIRSLAILSDGTKYENNEHLAKNLKKLARLQRQFSRQERGSRRHEKTRMKIAELHERITNQRTDALHKLTTDLVREYDMIAVETLDIKGMMGQKKSHDLARRIGDAAWGTLLSQLEYKADWYGKMVVSVDKTFPSTQICSACGAKHPFVSKTMPLKWTCPSCGAEHDVDVNAAKNLLEEGRRILAEGQAPGMSA